jgi:hypothetical protein
LKHTIFVLCICLSDFLSLTWDQSLLRGNPKPGVPSSLAVSSDIFWQTVLQLWFAPPPLQWPILAFCFDKFLSTHASDTWTSALSYRCYSPTFQRYLVLADVTIFESVPYFESTHLAHETLLAGILFHLLLSLSTDKIRNYFLETTLDTKLMMVFQFVFCGIHVRISVAINAGNCLGALQPSYMWKIRLGHLLSYIF